MFYTVCYSQLIFKIMTKEMQEQIEKAQKNREGFEEAARPLIKWLCENWHPHVTAIVTPTSCELLESKCANPNIDDYILD